MYNNLEGMKNRKVSCCLCLQSFQIQVGVFFNTLLLSMRTHFLYRF